MRLIDADALGIGKANPNVFVVPEIAEGWNSVIDIIAAAPTVDAVPVVRCKDCINGKYWKNAFGIDGFKCDLLCVDISPEAFCSYGERKENENV